MATVSQLIERLQNLRDNLPQIVADSIEQSKDKFLALNASQLVSGLDGLGKTTLDGVDFYQPSTIRKKKRYGVGYGSITDHITLYDSGEMQKSETLEIQGDQVITDFNTDYSKYVLDRTGPAVLSLNEENKTNYIFGPMFEAMRPKVEELTQLTLA